MKINTIQNSSNFGSGFRPTAQKTLTKMITEIMMKNKQKDAAYCIQLTKDIKKESVNHTITISDSLKDILVFADDSNIGTDMLKMKITPRNLLQSLSKILYFIQKDNIKIPEIKKLSDKIFSQLKDNDDDFLSAGWHGMQDSIWSGAIYPDGKGRIISGKLAKLSMKKNNPKIVEDGLKIYQSIKENPANCRIFMDNCGNFAIKNLKTGQIYMVDYADFKHAGILSQLKKVEKIVRKQEKINEKLAKSEVQKVEKIQLKTDKTLKKIEIKNAIKEFWERSSLYKTYKEISGNIKNAIKVRNEKYNATFSKVEKDLW